MGKKIGVLIDLDFCVGCYACQSACRDYNKLPVGSTYLKTVNTKPEDIDGRLKMFMCPVPYKLEQCESCVEDANGAPCTSICVAKAIDIGDVELLITKAASINRRTCLFQ